MTASRRRNRYALLSIRALCPTVLCLAWQDLENYGHNPRSLCDLKIRSLTFYHLSIFAFCIIQVEDIKNKVAISIPKIHVASIRIIDKYNRKLLSINIVVDIQDFLQLLIMNNRGSWWFSKINRDLISRCEIASGCYNLHLIVWKKIFPQRGNCALCAIKRSFRKTYWSRY